jgi:trimethylamine--corrinoid protein Co-methyltransferase
MTAERRTRGRRGKADRGAERIPQLPWRRVENPFPPLQFATEEQIETIHRTSIRVLSDLGIRVMGDRVMELFEAAGGRVDRSDGTVRIGEDLVDEALRTAPATFTLTPPQSRPGGRARRQQRRVRSGGGSAQRPRLRRWAAPRQHGGL